MKIELHFFFGNKIEKDSLPRNVMSTILSWIVGVLILQF